MEHVYGWRPGLGQGVGNTSCPGKEWPLGRGALPGACGWGWVGFPSSLLMPPALRFFFFFFLNSSFGPTVAFQSHRNKSLPNQDINTVGTCRYLCLRETVAPPGGWGSFQVQVLKSVVLTNSISWEPSLPVL